MRKKTPCKGFILFCYGKWSACLKTGRNESTDERLILYAIQTQQVVFNIMYNTLFNICNKKIRGLSYDYLLITKSIKIKTIPYPH